MAYRNELVYCVLFHVHSKTTHIEFEKIYIIFANPLQFNPYFAISSTKDADWVGLDCQGCPTHFAL